MRSRDDDNAHWYHVAQRALADLKAAILATLLSGPPEGMKNHEIGRALGIYMGHAGHEGHIPRTLLEILREEGCVEQDPESKAWRPLGHGK